MIEYNHPLFPRAPAEILKEMNSRRAERGEKLLDISSLQRELERYFKEKEFKDKPYDAVKAHKIALEKRAKAGGTGRLRTDFDCLTKVLILLLKRVSPEKIAQAFVGMPEWVSESTIVRFLREECASGSLINLWRRHRGKFANGYPLKANQTRIVNIVDISKRPAIIETESALVILRETPCLVLGNQASFS